ncbi:hypothetical protein SAY87_023150 [Trapa incisa]|uniref:Phosphoglucan phosphatase LSF2, chloroplastic n=1 Tax=Trapa incisa TaxID=236973 RepID=A0AAN7K7P1_9MYRT|nr:hypothetical protein SAY87_023150 [Trapa incisa]
MALASAINTCYSYPYSPISISMSHHQKHDLTTPRSHVRAFISSMNPHKASRITNKLPDGAGQRRIPAAVGGGSGSRMDEYNVAMKRMMRNPYEYHHDLGMNYTQITDNLIVGSQPQKPQDVEHLKRKENVAYILNLQQDRDIEYWGIDFEAILERCRDHGIQHTRTPARDFDPESLRNGLPKAVSSLEWAISDGKGRIYVHCTAGLGRAPAVVIAYLYWFCDMNLTKAYDILTYKRPCGPNKRAIRGATYDLAKNEWKEPFESLPEFAFEDITDWERKLIQDRVRSLRET